MTVSRRADWADEFDDNDAPIENILPEATQVTNKDGTITKTTWKFNDEGKKVKLTQRIRITTHKEVVNPRVAERKSWAKFGLSQKDAPGPATDTTSVGGVYSLRIYIVMARY